MKILKKNQLIILVIALMFIAAGYLSYTTNEPEQKLSSIGDAALVNSEEIIENESSKEQQSDVENEKVEETINTNVTDNYFANSRLERETMYSQMLETYQKLLESNTISTEQKAISQEQINKINQTKNGIMIAENLIKTKGFSDLVIFVNDNSISAVIQAQELLPEQIAQIQNIISRELKVEIENINISKK